MKIDITSALFALNLILLIHMIIPNSQCKEGAFDVNVG